MASLKRHADIDFEHRSAVKKICVWPIWELPIRCITKKVPSEVPRCHKMVTRAITTRHATNAVLGTYELLESILHELPMQTILEVRRVCKSWKHIIDRSKPLRTKLFLEAEPRRCLWVLDRQSCDLKPYEMGARERLGEEWMHGQALSRPSIVNPLLFRHDVNLRSGIKTRALLCEGIHFTASPDLTKVSRAGSIVHQMFVTQPPVSVVQFVFFFNASKAPGKQYRRAEACLRVKIAEPNGVRFGHMLEAFAQKAQRFTRFQSTSNLSIKAHSSSPARKSVIWMLGAIFVSEDEKATVEKLRQKAVNTESDEPGWVAKVMCLEEEDDE